MLTWIKEQGKENAAVVTRLGIVTIFLYFGIFQIVKPAHFLGYLPSFLFSKPYAQALVIGNGVFELIFAIALLVGFYTRLSAFLLGIHLLGITAHLAFSLSFLSDIVWRDIALTIVTFSIVLYGADKWCYDTKRNKDTAQTT